MCGGDKVEDIRGGGGGGGKVEKIGGGARGNQTFRWMLTDSKTFKLVHFILCSSFYCFTQTLKENVSGLLGVGGGGAKDMLAPFQNYWGTLPSPPVLRLC